MIIIHYDFHTGEEVSFEEGKRLHDNFKTCCLSFFKTSNHSRVIRKDGSYIDSKELLLNTGEYTNREIRIPHNICRLLKAGDFEWKQEKRNKQQFNNRINKEVRMINLPKGDTYEIKTLEDILNCPVNMQMEVLGVICEAFKARIDRIEKTGKRSYIKTIKMSVTNDGVNKSTVSVKTL